MKDPMKKARTALGKAVEVVAQWEEQRATQGAALAELEAHSGDDVLDGGPGTVERVARQTAELRAAVETASKGLAAARSRHEDARRAVLHAAAGTIEERATAAHRAVDAHEARTAKLLAELERHDGARYDPWKPDARTTERITYTAPKGLQLRAQARQLDASAAAIRALADAANITDRQLDEALAEADPDGPEAARIAERKAREAREIEAARQAQREEGARRREARERREALAQ